MDFTSLTKLYNLFRIYLLRLKSILEYFQVHMCFGAMWRLWSILELKKKEKTRLAVQETIQSRDSGGVSIDTDSLVSLDTDVNRWPVVCD